MILFPITITKERRFKMLSIYMNKTRQEEKTTRQTF